MKGGDKYLRVQLLFEHLSKAWPKEARLQLYLPLQLDQVHHVEAVQYTQSAHFRHHAL